MLLLIMKSKADSTFSCRFEIFLLPFLWCESDFLLFTGFSEATYPSQTQALEGDEEQQQRYLKSRGTFFLG